MDALYEYNSLILFRQQHPLPDDSTGEVHHIIPRCAGGTDDEWNKVRLETVEHIKAHLLLVDVYADDEVKNKLNIAVKLMLKSRKGSVLSPEDAAKARQLSYTITPQTRKKISDTLKGRAGKPHTQEEKKKISRALTGHSVNETTRKKISEARKQRKKHHRRKAKKRTRKPLSRRAKLLRLRKMRLNQQIKLKKLQLANQGLNQ